MFQKNVPLILTLALLTSVVCTAQWAGTGSDKDMVPAAKKGRLAPPFILKSPDGSEETDLTSFRGKRPVVLFFGSYT